MHVVTGRNAHELLPVLCRELKNHGVRRPSRNGDVLQFPTPVTVVFERPMERVVFWPERDANPFFHLYEALWMLWGENEVDDLAHFVPRMRDFADDDGKLWGAYGHRWMNHWGADQLEAIASNLRRDPDCRRQVLQMWDPRSDLFMGRGRRDVPCNTAAFFSISTAEDGWPVLDMMVTNRSNDLIWGLLGANCVHLSVMHEWLSRRIGVQVGTYRQVTNNLHLYVARHEGLMEQLADKPVESPYALGEVLWKPMDAFVGLRERLDFMRSRADFQSTRFHEEVSQPMFTAHALHGAHNESGALRMIEKVAATDWRRAGREWLERRRVR